MAKKPTQKTGTRTAGRASAKSTKASPADTAPDAAADPRVAAAEEAEPKAIAAWPPETGARWHGRYLLGEKVGTDAFGAIFSAHDALDDRSVELVIFHPAFAAKGVHDLNRERLERTLAFGHPHIAGTFDVATSEGLLFVVTAPRVGSSLALWRREASRERVELLSLFAQFLSAVEAIHDAGAVHGAITAEVLRVVQDQAWLVCPWWLDAGGAALDGVSRPRMTWVAPEALAADGAPGPSADIYGLGLALGFLLARGLTEPETSLVEQGIEIPSEVDAAYITATALDAGARHPDVATFRRALAEAFGPEWAEAVSGGAPRTEARHESTDEDVPVPVRAAAVVLVPELAAGPDTADAAGVALQDVDVQAETLDQPLDVGGVPDSMDFMPPPPPLETGTFEPPEAGEFEVGRAVMGRPWTGDEDEPPPPPPPVEETAYAPLNDILASKPSSGLHRRVTGESFPAATETDVASEPTMDLDEFLRSIHAATETPDERQGWAAGAAASSGGATAFSFDADDGAPPVGLNEPTIIEGFSPSLIDDLDIFQDMGREEGLSGQGAGKAQSARTEYEPLPPPPPGWNDSPFVSPREPEAPHEPTVTMSSPTIATIPGPASRPQIRPGQGESGLKPDFAGVLQTPLTRQEVKKTRQRRRLPVALMIALVVLVVLTIALLVAALNSGEPQGQVAQRDEAEATVAEGGGGAVTDPPGAADEGGEAKSASGLGEDGAEAGVEAAAVEGGAGSASDGADGSDGGPGTAGQEATGPGADDDGPSADGGESVPSGGTAGTEAGSPAGATVVADAGLGADEAAADEAAADKAAADKAAADKAAADKAAADKAAAAHVPVDPDALNCPAGMAKVKRKITVTLSGGASADDWEVYCIDRHEYPGAGSMPKVNVDFAGARSACAAKGKRLCTATEWRRACGGTYPYGRTYVQDNCHLVTKTGGSRPPIAAGSKAACRSWVGAMDMVGNVAEWTAGGTVHGGSSHKDGENATCGSKSRRVGGAPYIGFRCCADPK